MPRRELLTPAERESLLTVPVIEAEQIRHYSLSRSDLAFIRQHRWDYNRLGVAIQLCYLRYPGRVLARGETPPAALLAMVASQLKTTPALWDQYASRDQTRREHQALARGDTHAALDSLQKRGRLHAADDREQARQELVRDWNRSRDVNQPGEDLMLGATRTDVRALNRLARERLHEQGELKGERLVEADNGPLALAEGDRIVITRNAKLLGMMNGDLGTVTSIAERRGEVEITAKLNTGRTRTWHVSEHPHIEHGYTRIAHKAQGASVERAITLLKSDAAVVDTLAVLTGFQHTARD